MLKINLKFLVLLLIILMVSCRSSQQGVRFADVKSPKREFRGAWLSTAWQSRYKTMTPNQMKQYFSESLDKLQAMGINAVIFQVRPQADAFYKSKYEPWSAHLSGQQGVAPANGFDPLACLIEECHKRNIELHAWLNPYRVTTSNNDKLASNHVYYTNPDKFVTYGGKIYFNPGEEFSRNFVCKVVEDILLHYDVDAIHMDDYFYPYPIAGEAFPDRDTFLRTYKQRGFNINQQDDWRRDNVSLLVKEIKDVIMNTKPWVRFGISPFGIYRNKRSTPDASGSNTNGLQNYDDLYADIKLWVEKGWIDYNMPQLYWEIGHKSADYLTLLDWWAKNNFDQPLYIGEDVERTMKSIPPYDTNQLNEKIYKARAYPQVSGFSMWPAYSLLDNYNNVANELSNQYFEYPSLIPAYTHMYDKHPKKVRNLKTEYTPSAHLLKWTSNHRPDDPITAQYYVVYRFEKGEHVDIDNAEKIVAITRDTQYQLPYEGSKNKYVYVVTSVDRFHNESKPEKKKVKI